MSSLHLISDPTLSQRGEPSQISWASIQFCSSGVKPSNDQKILQPTHSLTDSRMEMNKCYCCKESATKIITNLAISLVLTTLSPRNLTSFTRLLLTGRCACAGHETRVATAATTVLMPLDQHNITHVRGSIGHSI